MTPDAGGVSAAADAPHPPSDDPWWSEAWHLDVVQDDGTGLYVRLECFPNRRVAWFWTALVLPDLAGPVLVREQEVPLPRQGLEIRAESLWAELWCETPLEHWTYGLEAFGVRLDAPVDAYHGELGERVAVGLDIEWELTAPPAAYDAACRRTARLRATRARRRRRPARPHASHDRGDRGAPAVVGRRATRFGAPAFGAWYRSDDVDVTVRVDAGRVQGQVWRRGAFERAVSHLREETHARRATASRPRPGWCSTIWRSTSRSSPSRRCSSRPTHASRTSRGPAAGSSPPSVRPASAGPGGTTPSERKIAAPRAEMTRDCRHVFRAARRDLHHDRGRRADATPSPGARRSKALGSRAIATHSGSASTRRRRAPAASSR